MCYCGDPCCPSCGPATGNYRCDICGAWAYPGCDHIDDDGNEVDAFAAEFAKARARQAADDARYAEECARIAEDAPTTTEAREGEGR